MDTIFYYFNIMWEAWTAMFRSLPFGDPWLAYLTFFFVIFLMAWRFAHGSPKTI